MRHPARRAFFHVVDTMDAAAAAVEKSGAAANKFYQGTERTEDGGTDGTQAGRRSPDADGWTDKVFITVSIICA